MPLPELVAWLAEEARAKRPIPILFDGFCARLAGGGLPIWRASLGLEALHPQISGSLVVWREGALEEPRRAVARAGILTNPSYVNSPTRIVDDSGEPYRWRAPAPSGGITLIDELAAEGMTDYVMLPLPILDSNRSAVVSFATCAPDGFADAAIATFAQSAALLTPLVERLILRETASNLLQAYLGGDAGRRVYLGQIDRGDVETITAAILFCDLRGFTALSERLSRRDLVALLNRWFEAIGAAIEKQGGQILKFLGDGLLAVFPLGEELRVEIICERALEAALDAEARCDGLNEALASEGQPALRFGMALHLGEVEFGNIGTAARLDFTVIGPAVNLASRIEGATKQLGEAILASPSFAAAVRREMQSLGHVALRDLPTPVELFAPLRRGE